MYKLVAYYDFGDKKPYPVEDFGGHTELQNAVEHAERVVKNDCVCYIDIKDAKTDKTVTTVSKETVN